MHLHVYQYRHQLSVELLLSFHRQFRRLPLGKYLNKIKPNDKSQKREREREAKILLVRSNAPRRATTNNHLNMAE